MKALLSIILLLTFGACAWDEYTPSPEEFAEWKEAAANGDPAAQFNLGVAYYHAKGVPVDYTEAAMRFKKAAEKGDAGAQHDLAVMYADGQGVPQDHKEAAKWYRKAAEQGYSDAQYNLGGAYLFGNDVKEDNSRAFAWLGISADNGHEQASQWKALLVVDMSKEQIAEAQQLSTKMVKANPKLIN
jgi:hypothetical protein